MMNNGRKQYGQSFTEYMVVLIIVMVLLGVGFADEGSVISILLNAVQEGFDRFSSFMSLP